MPCLVSVAEEGVTSIKRGRRRVGTVKMERREGDKGRATEEVDREYPNPGTDRSK